MADKRYYWLKLPKDFFLRNEIRILESMPNGKEYLLFYIALLLMSTETKGVLHNRVRTLAFKTGTNRKIAEDAVKAFAGYGLIEEVDEDHFRMRYITRDTVISSEETTGRDRHTAEYKLWRTLVFERDDFTCQDCDTRGTKINAHHIKPWYLYPGLRFDVSNGITLCESCHKKRHKEN